jgi:hypothetical protein
LQTKLTTPQPTAGLVSKPSAQQHTVMLHLLYRVMAPCAIYRGVAITNSNGCYYAVGKTYPSLQEAKEAVDRCYEAIAKSIKKASLPVAVTVE